MSATLTPMERIVLKMLSPDFDFGSVWVAVATLTYDEAAAIVLSLEARGLAARSDRWRITPAGEKLL